MLRADRPDERERIARSADDERHVARGVAGRQVPLVERAVELRFDLRGDAVVPHVGDDADDRDPGTIGSAHPESPVEWILAGPVLRGHRLVDERDVLAPRGVVRGEPRPRTMRSPSASIPSSDAICQSPGVLTPGGGW